MNTDKRYAYLAAHGLHPYLRMHGPLGWSIRDTRTGEVIDGGAS